MVLSARRMSAAADDVVSGAGVALRLRRWDALHALPEQPLTQEELAATAGKTDVKITLGCKVLPARRLFLKFNAQGRRRRVLEGRETRRTDGTSLQGGGWGLSVVDWICGSAGSVALPGRGGCGHRSLFWRFVRFESAADISASDAAAAMQQQ